MSEQPMPGPQDADGPVLPDQTGDDTDLDGGDWREDGGHDSTSDRDEWLERQRPPHWE
jgi:hypothetical protein